MSLLLPIFTVAVIAILGWAFLEKRKLEARMREHASEQKHLEERKRNFDSRLAAKAAEIEAAAVAASDAAAKQPGERTAEDKGKLAAYESLASAALPNLGIVGLMRHPNIVFTEVPQGSFSEWVPSAANDLLSYPFSSVILTGDRARAAIRDKIFVTRAFAGGKNKPVRVAEPGITAFEVTDRPPTARKSPPPQRKRISE